MTQDLRPKYAHHRLDFDVLGKPDVLRRMVAEGQTDAQIGVAAGCCADTVQRWRMLYEIKRPNCKLAAKMRRQATRMDQDRFRQVVARAYARAGRCWYACPERERCLDDERACRLKGI